ncbi:hypothetical protein EGM51_07935 [Verrucomicrobia bacterium S94]|nr:hypothetical protein EGM51_07935 [Verrucomicrobia bacterium S94]
MLLERRIEIDMKRLFYILLFVGSFLFYWETGNKIENRTEAEDVFEYALMVEQGSEHLWFYHEHHLLYAPLMRSVFTAAGTLGYEGRAISVMRLFSALSAAGTLFFFFLFCYKRYSLRPVSSLISTLFMGVSYGFWRYSAESEIPLIASFFITAALYYSTDEVLGKRSFILSVIFSIAAVMMHIMNAIAVFIAIPAFYLVQRRPKLMSLHIGLSFLFISGIYFVTDQLVHIHLSGRTQFSMIGLGSLVKAAVGFFQCLISNEFLLGFRSIRAFLGELFAGRMLQEEFYLGVRLSRYHVLFSTCTFFLFFGVFAVCIGRAVWIWKNIISERKRYRLPFGIRALIPPALFFSGYGFLLLFIEPGNPELWVMGMMPFCLLLCGVVLLPLTVDNRLWLPFLMTVLLFVHNSGALQQLYDADKDYQQNKAESVLKIARASDLVVTAGNPVFERYLRYHFKGDVLYLHEWSEDRLLAFELPETEGEVFILGDVFNQPSSLRIRFPRKTAAIEQFSNVIKEHVRLVEDDPFGGVYILERQGN